MDEVDIFPSRDEAIAAAFLESEEGDEVLIHDETCAMRSGDECSCAPEVHVVEKGTA